MLRAVFTVHVICKGLAASQAAGALCHRGAGRIKTARAAYRVAPAVVTGRDANCFLSSSSPSFEA